MSLGEGWCTRVVDRIAAEHSHVVLDDESVNLLLGVLGVVFAFGIATGVLALVVGASFTMRREHVLPVHVTSTPRQPTLRALPRSLKRA